MAQWPVAVPFFTVMTAVRWLASGPLYVISVPAGIALKLEDVTTQCVAVSHTFSRWNAGEAAETDGTRAMSATIVPAITITLWIERISDPFASS